jgi:hypothetical protein
MKIYVREVVVYPIRSWKEYYTSEEKANELYSIRHPSKGIYVNDDGTRQTRDLDLFKRTYCNNINDIDNTPEEVKNKIFR